MPEHPLSYELGQLRGEVTSLTVMVRDQVLPKLDALAPLPATIAKHLADDEDVQDDHEKRVRALEKTNSEKKGEARSFARWSAGFNALVTLAINAAFVIVTGRTAH